MLSKIKKGVRFLTDTFINLLSPVEVTFIVEDSDWVILKEGLELSKAIKPFMSARTSLSHIVRRGSIIQFGSIHTFVTSKGLKQTHPDNKVFVTWYHFTEDDKRVKYLPEILKSCKKIHTSCQISRQMLLTNGVPENRIFLAPIPFDPGIFNPENYPSGEELKKKYNIPHGKIVIGSFQKDGNGFGEGNEPKLIKGPDLFCDVVIELHKKFPVHVLLTGPARGYVKKRLSEANVSFSHFNLENPDEVAPFYKCLDLYLMTSRAEGGPKSMTESWAMGIPYVATKVGMVADYCIDGNNALVAEVDDKSELLKNCIEIIANPELRKKIVFQAKNDVTKLTYSEVIKIYLSEYK